MKTNKASPHFNKGKRTNIALVFSCPGQEEEYNKKPVFGRTGTNLETILNHLVKMDSSFKPYKDRYDFRITNASSNVHFKDKTGRSEELDSKLFLESNLSRLHHELQDIKTNVICFGRKAEKTIKKLLNDPKYKGLIFKPVYTRHLGNQSLNRMTVHNAKNNNIDYKLKKLAREISARLKK